MNRQFPALRGLAIFLVVVNHSIALTLANGIERGYDKAVGIERYALVAFKHLGLIAVPIFLFLSAAFLVYALQGKDFKASYRVIGSGLKHVLWPYLVWSAVFYIVMYFLRGEVSAPLQYLKNLLVGYPFNFVPLLVFFYLLAPLLVWAGRRYPWLVVAAFGLYQLFLIGAQKPGWLGVTFPAWTYALTLPVLRVTLAIWGVFFPLGVVYSLHAKAINPVLRRLLWPLLALALGLYVVAVLHETGSVNLPMAEILLPVPIILLLTQIRRDAIPNPRLWERLGKKAFGLYLTNLIVIYLLLAGLSAAWPWLAQQYWITAPLMLFLAVVIPFAVMEGLERRANSAVLRYVFG